MVSLSSWGTPEVAWDDTARTLEVVGSCKVDLMAYACLHLQCFVDNAVTVLERSMLNELVHDVFLSHDLDCIIVGAPAVIPVVHQSSEVHLWVQSSVQDCRKMHVPIEEVLFALRKLENLCAHFGQVSPDY